MAHIDCKAEDAVFMPTRVLDVSWTANEDKSVDSRDEIRLVEFTSADSLGAAGAYAALSYCWGSDLIGVVKTEKTNLETHRRGILLSSLSQTAQDAVQVSRGLGIRYLWIDALCIIQGDVEDWRREGAQMHRIYSNSLVTLAVHASPSCKDGFLGPQSYGQPSWQKTFTTESWTGRDDEGCSVSDETDIDTPNISSSNRVNMRLRLGELPEDFNEVSPLMQRGWTFQEALLARRTVHFTGAELIWECSSRHLCECGHIEGMQAGNPHPMLKTKVMSGKSSTGAATFSPRLGGPPPPPSISSFMLVDGWMRLVSNYSERKLSFTSDKLVALSGLAQQLAAMDPSLKVSLNVHFPCPKYTTFVVDQTSY